MSKTKQICKHEIDWDDVEYSYTDEKTVTLQVSCSKCYDYWQLEYHNVALWKADKFDDLVPVDDFEQNTDGTYPEDTTVSKSE